MRCNHKPCSWCVSMIGKEVGRTLIFSEVLECLPSLISPWTIITCKVFFKIDNYRFYTFLVAPNHLSDLFSSSRSLVTLNKVISCFGSSLFCTHFGLTPLTLHNIRSVWSLRTQRLCHVLDCASHCTFNFVSWFKHFYTHHMMNRWKVSWKFKQHCLLHNSLHESVNLDQSFFFFFLLPAHYLSSKNISWLTVEFFVTCNCAELCGFARISVGLFVLFCECVGAGWGGWGAGGGGGIDPSCAICLPCTNLVIERLRVQVPAGAVEEFSSPELTFYADSCSMSIPTPCCRSGTLPPPPPQPFCQKCWWQLTSKHAYTFDQTKSEGADYAVRA